MYRVLNLCYFTNCLDQIEMFLYSISYTDSVFILCGDINIDIKKNPLEKMHLFTYYKSVLNWY